ncbi:MAG: hypothetical protein AAFQ73_07620 [Pseudomonadota bacterium]
MGTHLKAALKRAETLPKSERKLLAQAIEDWIREAERAAKRKAKSGGKSKTRRKKRLAEFQARMAAERAADRRPKTAGLGQDGRAPRGVALDQWSAGVRDLVWEDYFPAS